MIVLDEVVRTFGDVRAVDGIDLQIASGEVLGLLGHNGAGKTTTVRLIVGLLAATSGNVRVDGLDPIAEGVAVRRRTGVLSASPAVDDRLTGRANLRFVADLHGVPTREVGQRVEESLDLFGLRDVAAERAGGYSTGLRQRLSLARVLLSEPDILLLDEPTAALDPIAARQVRGTIADLSSRRGRTVILCTHDLAEAQQLCDRVAVLERGRIVALGTPRELAQQVGARTVDIEVDAGEAETAGKIARALLGPADHPAAVTVLGPGRIRLPGAERALVPTLVSALVAGGLSVFGVVANEPSLEEVYVALHERGGR
jgi:ABC-type multidrug transport system ATPase subunit